VQRPAAGCCLPLRKGGGSVGILPNWESICLGRNKMPEGAVRMSARRRRVAIGVTGLVLCAAMGLVQAATATEGWLKPHCQRGSAALGNRPGLIAFSVSCRRGKGRFFRFIATRADRLGKHVTISSFSSRPRLSGPGAVARNGFCQRLRQEIACRGRGRGKVRLRGWIRVPPIRQCRSQIRLVQVVPSACNPNRDEECSGALKLDQLFAAIPKGC
jgi:hypothetical protein